MTKEIAFLIWLYERQIECNDTERKDESNEVDYIRRVYMEGFGIDSSLSDYSFFSYNVKSIEDE